MGPVPTLEKFLETDKVTCESTHHGLYTLRSEEGVKRISYGWSSVSEATGRWNRGVIPTDAVGSRIRAHEIGSEGTSCNLEVVRGIAPSTETSVGIRVEKG